MTARFISALSVTIFATGVAAQSAVDVVRPEEQQKARRAVVKEQEKRAKRASIIEFRGAHADPISGGVRRPPVPARDGGGRAGADRVDLHRGAEAGEDSRRCQVAHPLTGSRPRGRRL